jgi:hypothetical protein
MVFPDSVLSDLICSLSSLDEALLTLLPCRRDGPGDADPLCRSSRLLCCTSGPLVGAPSTLRAGPLPGGCQRRQDRSDGQHLTQGRDPLADRLRRARQGRSAPADTSRAAPPIRVSTRPPAPAKHRHAREDDTAQMDRHSDEPQRSRPAACAGSTSGHDEQERPSHDDPEKICVREQRKGNRLPAPAGQHEAQRDGDAGTEHCAGETLDPTRQVSNRKAHPFQIRRQNAQRQIPLSRCPAPALPGRSGCGRPRARGLPSCSWASQEGSCGYRATSAWPLSRARHRGRTFPSTAIRQIK